MEDEEEEEESHRGEACGEGSLLVLDDDKCNK